MAMPIETMVPIMPRARPRSRLGKTSVMIAIPSACSMTAPRPCKARKPISQYTLGERPHSSEPLVNSTRPAVYRPFFPCMSPRRAMVSISEVTTST